MMTVYVPLGKKVIDGVESDGMLASGVGARHQPRSRRASSNSAVGRRAACARSASSRSTTRASRIGPICGAITAWRAKWRRSLGQDAARSGRSSDLLPHGRAGDQGRDRRSRRSARATARWSSRTSRCSRRRLWLQYRLTAIGLNPINNIVDVTNFVMAELAQPMHAFDARPAAGRHDLRAAARKAGERFVALNDEEYTLDAVEPGDRRCRRAPIAIAGVIGGGDSAISEKTTRVVLESANFQASSIRKTSSALKLRTDASHALREGAGPGEHGARPGARGRTAARGFAGHPAGGRPGRSEARDRRRRRRSSLPLDWLERKLGRADRARRRCGAFWRAWSSASTEAAARRLLGDRARAGAPPKTSRSRTIWWKKSAA